MGPVLFVVALLVLGVSLARCEHDATIDCNAKGGVFVRGTCQFPKGWPRNE